MTSSIPPGWYKDPSARGVVRWWDGSAWGQETAPERPPRVLTPSAAPVLGPVERKRRNRRQLLLVVVLTVVGFVGLSTVWALSQGSPCEQAQDEVDDVLRAMALFGEDDPGLRAEYVVRAAQRAEACAP